MIASFAQLLNSRLHALSHTFAENEDGFVLTVNGRSIEFRKSDSSFQVKPNAWLRRQHSDNSIHEPGLVATLDLLGEMIDRKVIFYDVGALFGYFSLLALQMFKDVTCVAVEGNPYSSRCIREISQEPHSLEIMNVVLGKEQSQDRYLIDGFHFIPESSMLGRRKALSARIKNAGKQFANMFGGNSETHNLESHAIETRALPSLFRHNTTDALEIYKFDTEGYQAVFLPPFIDELCDRRPIVLLETDAPDKMARFGSSNDALLQMFLKRGYQAVWMDHRNGGDAEVVSAILPEHDKNALCVLLPDELIAGLVSQVAAA